MPATSLKGLTDRRAKSSPKFTGGSALAREFGVTSSTISRKMRDGQTVEQIRAWYESQGLGNKNKVEPKQAESAIVRRSVYQGTNKHAPKAATQSVPKPSLPPSPTPAQDDPDEQEIPGWIPGSDGQNDFATLNAAKNRKEVALADKHELDLAERRRELIDRQAVGLYFSGMLTRARDSLLRIPGELRDRLAASSNPIECEKLVRKEITQALAVLRDYTPSGRA